MDTAAGRSGELTERDFTIIERDEEKEIREFQFTSSTADVAFVFDDTSSMAEEIEDMKASVKSLTDDIENAGINARYSLITFKDDIETDLEFTADATRLKNSVDDLSESRGGDTPEDNFDAIVSALGLNYRPDAQKILVDITDAVSHYQGDGSGVSGHTIDEVTTRVQESGVAYIAVAPDTDDPQASKKTLAARTDGLWIDIKSADFSRILRRIRRIVATVYVLEYRTEALGGESREISCQVDDPDRGLGTDSTTVDVPSDVSDGATASQTLEVVSTSAGSDLSYQFTVDGDVSKSEANDNRADPDDEIAENDDGTVTVTGTTGDEQGDVFAVVGNIVEFEKTSGESGVQLLLDGVDVTNRFLGSETSPDGGDDASLLEIVSTEEGEYSYRFEVSGGVEKAYVSEKIQSQENDEIRTTGSDTVVDGYTGNPGYGDAYRITGEITDFEHVGGDADVIIRLDGEDVTDRFVGSETSPDDGDDASLLEIVSTEEGEYSYRFEVSGSVEKAYVSEKIQSQENDEIRTTGSDTVVDGYTGNPGYGDAYRITGEITDFEHVGGDADVIIRLDGEEISIDELT